MRDAFLFRLLIWCVGLYGALCLLVFLFQRSLLYVPSRYGESEGVKIARAHGLEPWRDAQGRLRGWRHAGAPGAACVVVCHGNAGSALDRAYFVPLLDGCEVILLEYPGYGSRPGDPAQPALVADAAEALADLRQAGRRKLVLVGESLGSGVAVQAAARLPAAVDGLLLVTPVARMTDVAARHYPYLPTGLLLRDRWDNAAAVQGFHGPVAVLVAGRDEVVGAEQGRKLAAVCRRVRVWEQPLAGHNSVDVRAGAVPWAEMLAYLQVGGASGSAGSKDAARQ